MENSILSRLNRCHLKFNPNWNHKTEVVNAKQLLSPLRFDLYAILQYIDQKVKGVTDISFAKKIYYYRTYIITGYTCSEVGNDNKNTFDDFIVTLDNLIVDFLNNRYDQHRTIIPVDKNYVILDGAHRVCCAAYFNKSVEIIRFIDKDFKQHVTADYLIRNGLPEFAADSMAIEYTKWHKNIFMLFIWPKSFCYPDKLNQAEELIKNDVNVIYRKRSKLSYNAVRNLMIQIYGHMPWIGTVDNEFHNTFVKANEVWDNNGNVEFILCESSSCNHILELKQKVRNIFNINLASIHSTDNDIETITAANLIFNPNSMHHLNLGHPDKFKKAHHLIESFKEQIQSKHLDVSQFVIDSSMVLSIYGIRSASDLDYYTLYPDSKEIRWANEIENHKDFIKYYDKSNIDLIENSQNYFIYNGLKFISLPNVLTFKKNRGEKKDLNDIKLIKSYTNNNKFRLYLFTQKDKLRRNKIKYKNLFRKKLRNLFIKIGIQNFISKLYHLIK